MNLAGSLRILAQSRPLHPALVHSEATILYRDLDGLVRRTASWLAGQGIQRGDVIGVALQDTATHLVTLLALAGLGAILLPMDCRWTVAEQERIARRFKAKRVLLESEAVWHNAVPAVRCDSAWNEGVASAGPIEELAQGADLPLLLSLSSGTTGMAKGPLITHEQFMRRFWTHWVNLGLNAQSRYISATPLYFGGGRTFALSQLFCGGTVIMFPPPYRAEELVEEVRRQGGTALFLVPTLLRRLLALEALDRLLMPSLTLLLSSGSPLQPEERLAIRRKITPHFYEMYATTEGGGVSLLTPQDQSVYGDSVGRCMFAIEVQVVDGEGRQLPAGEIGVLRYRSPGCATEFFGDPQATAEMFKDGWFYPGDLGAVNEEGYLFLKGRRKDMIIRGGVNIYPNEIEEALAGHAKVAEVAVAGIPSPEMGEEVAAFVVANGAVRPEELLALCRGRLAPYKVPKAIFFVDDMPRNSAGKVLKAELVKLASKLAL